MTGSEPGMEPDLPVFIAGLLTIPAWKWMAAAAVLLVVLWGIITIDRKIKRTNDEQKKK